jgi:multidrug efflux pump subunit AcrA (membrane-fusion protein)
MQALAVRAAEQSTLACGECSDDVCQIAAKLANLAILSHMPPPLHTGGAPPESQTWQELEDVFSALGQLARSAVTPHEFYRQILDQSVRALSAAGGIVWLRAGAAMQPIVQMGRASADSARSEDSRRTHEELLLEVMQEGRVFSVAPHTVDEEHPKAANLTDHWLVLGPVILLPDGATADTKRTAERGATIAIIELWMCKDASPARYRGGEQLLEMVCELAADYHAFHELRRMRRDEHHRSELLELSRLVHLPLNLSATAYAVANEGRRVIDCDRLSVLVARGNSCRLLAASGVSRVERRSGAARKLAKVAEQVRQTDEPAFYADGECDALPPVAEAIARHVEESHARHIAAIPLRPPLEPNSDDASFSKNERRDSRSLRPQFVLIAEQFDAREGELRRDWLVEVGRVSTTALYNALTLDRMPLGWLLRPLGKVKEAVAAHVTRTALIVAAVAAAVAALVLVPADFHVDAPGILQPSVRRNVFAPRNGVVDEVLVKHGADVAMGQPLVKMRDPSLDLELKRVDGELETAQRQLDAVRATKTNRAIRETNPVESYRLSAEERELEQKVANSRRELDLLKHEREQLVVTSPIAGRVLTWDVGHQLLARPVERGEVLVAVADLSSPWQLELAVPDDRIGYVLAAQKISKANLPVRFRLGSEERASHTGKIAEVCQTADLPTDKTTRPTPTILTKVTLDPPALMASLGGELRPGVSARAQIECGRRPLGYVWLHDVWNAAVQWWKF